MLGFLKQKNRNNPPGYSNASILSYYSEKQALELLPYLITLQANPTKKITFNSIKLNVRPQTLYHMINQGWLWLIENHPQKDDWRELRIKYNICKEKHLIVIRIGNSKQPITASAEVLEDDVERDYTKVADWRNTLVEYVETSVDGAKPLELRNLRLNDIDQDWLSSYLGGLDEKIAVIIFRPSMLKVVKNAALAKRLREQKT